MPIRDKVLKPHQSPRGHVSLSALAKLGVEGGPLAKTEAEASCGATPTGNPTLEDTPPPPLVLQVLAFTKVSNEKAGL